MVILHDPASPALLLFPKLCVSPLDMSKVQCYCCLWTVHLALQGHVEEPA